VSCRRDPFAACGRCSSGSRCALADIRARGAPTEASRRPRTPTMRLSRGPSYVQDDVFRRYGFNHALSVHNPRPRSRLKPGVYFTVRVKLCTAFDPTPLLAVNVRAYVPFGVVPFALKTPVPALKVTPAGAPD